MRTVLKPTNKCCFLEPTEVNIWQNANMVIVETHSGFVGDCIVEIVNQDGTPANADQILEMISSVDPDFWTVEIIEDSLMSDGVCRIEYEQNLLIEEQA